MAHRAGVGGHCGARAGGCRYPLRHRGRLPFSLHRQKVAELNGFYTTEEDGRRLDLFPISEALRYRFPFSPAAEAVQYLESLAGEGEEAAVYFDDIEKFGIWPETYEWVYEKGWLEDFIAAC